MEQDANWAIDLARKYRPQKGQANIYGVIIYTAEHAAIRQVLANDYYWEGLDEVSGPNWVVFAVRAAAGKEERTPRSAGASSVMRAVWKEPAENRQLLDAFDLSSTKKLPLLVVFAEPETDETYSTNMPIAGNTEQAAYNSLKSLLAEVNETVTGMLPESRAKEQRAFNLVADRFRNRKEWRLVKRTFSFFQWLKSLS